MATSQTNNYYLNQWMPNDQVLRREFNEDNYKIDMAMHAIADRLTTVGAQAYQLTNNAYTKQNPPLALGFFTGDGTQSQTITLGFQPKAVLVLRSNLKPNSDHFFANGLALDKAPSSTGAEITSRGFTVYNTNDGETICATNEKGVLYIYFAVK